MKASWAPVDDGSDQDRADHGPGRSPPRVGALAAELHRLLEPEEGEDDPGGERLDDGFERPAGREGVIGPETDALPCQTADR
jgi:hypothetical protein